MAGIRRSLVLATAEHAAFGYKKANSRIERKKPGELVLVDEDIQAGYFNRSACFHSGACHSQTWTSSNVLGSSMRPISTLADSGVAG